MEFEGIEGMRTDVPSLCEEYAQGEEDEKCAGACPSVCRERC